MAKLTRDVVPISDKSNPNTITPTYIRKMVTESTNVFSSHRMRASYTLYLTRASRIR